jgi:hypothetical protein
MWLAACGFRRWPGAAQLDSVGTCPDLPRATAIYLTLTSKRIQVWCHAWETGTSYRMGRFVDAIVNFAICYARRAGRPWSAVSSPVLLPDLSLGSSADMTQMPIAEGLFSWPARPT